MAIQADKPKDDWYKLVKELQDRERSKEKPSEGALQDTKLVTLNPNDDDEKGGTKSPGRRSSWDIFKEIVHVISPKSNN